jgi:hypothetical protein
MTTAADLQALFQGVLTPQALAARDQAEEQQMLAYYAQDQDHPWKMELQRSINTLSKAAPNSPYQQQKRQAEANQAVLASSTQKFRDLVKEGSDPGEAQLSILGDAIDQFSQQGNYEAISALAPTYLALQTKQAEVSKLRQEERTSAANESKSRTETALLPIEQVRKTQDSLSTRATQDVQRQKDRFDMSKTDGLQILDLTDPKAGPVVASIDPVTRSATITNPQTGITKVLKHGQYQDMSGKQGGTQGRPMPNTVAKDIRTAGQELDRSEELLDGFRPDFGGYKLKEAGDADMMLKRNMFGDKRGAAEWWASYQSKIQTVRHGLYGANFTKPEQAEWNKQAVNPGMRPEVIQTRLAAQKAIEDKVAERLYKGWAFNYDPAQISAFMGREYTEDAPEAPAASGTPATSGPKAGTVEDGYRFKGGNPADPSNWEKT